MEPINVLGLAVYPYGLCIAAALIVCLFWADKRFRKENLPGDLLSLVAALALPLCLVFARLGYCLCAYEQLIDGSVRLLNLRGGGYLFYGALLGGMLACVIAGKLRRVSAARIMDALTAPAALLIVFGRLAEGLIGENYGWSIEDWFAEESGMASFMLEDASFFCRFPFGVQDMYETWNWAVYMVMALAAVLLLVLVLRTDAGKPGRRTLLFVTGYAAAQVICESLRQGEVLRFGFVRWNQVFSAIALVIVLAVCCRLAGATVTRKKKVFAWIALVLCACVIVAMEFALEGKIDVIEWVPMDIEYLVGTCACVGMFFAVKSVWDPATKA